jgi:hypothetical protein
MPAAAPLLRGNTIDLGNREMASIGGLVRHQEEVANRQSDHESAQHEPESPRSHPTANDTLD